MRILFILLLTALVHVDLSAQSVRYLRFDGYASSDSGQINIMEIEAYAGGQNLATDATITTNSAQESVSLLTDGNTGGSRFSTNRNNPGQPSEAAPHRIELDFGTAQAIDEVRIYLEGGWTVSFGLFLSMDGQTWTELETYSSVSGTVTKTIPEGFYVTLTGQDDDGDGLDNALENGTGFTSGFSYGTDPNDADSDDDGLNDGAEVSLYFTNPLAPDTDADGLSDSFEINTNGSDPLLKDTDGDLLYDGNEQSVLVTESDHDGDGFSNRVELAYNSDPNDADSIPSAGTAFNLSVSYFSNLYLACVADRSHSLALKSDGTVEGWGQNWAGQATPPAGLSNVIGIAAGDDHSLALKSDGTVVGWGQNWAGQATPPAGLSNVIGIAAGNDHSLALKSDGTVVGWGDYGSQSINASDVSHVRGNNFTFEPLLVSTFPDSELTAGSDTQIDFNVSANADRVEVRRNGSLIYEVDNPDVSHSVSIDNFSSNEAGIYEVIAYNGDGVKIERQRIEIIGSPSLQLSGSDATASYQLSNGVRYLLSDSSIPVQLSSSFTNHTIYYSTDGTYPSPLPSNLYSVSLDFPAGNEVTLRAVAWNADFTQNVEMPSVVIHPSDAKTLTVESSNDGAVLFADSGVAASAGDYLRASGETVWVRADAAADYHFVQWEDGSTAQFRQLSLESDKSVSALFSPNLQSNLSESSGGFASIYPLRSSYEPGLTVAIQAIPTDGWYFKRWEDGFSGAQQSFYLPMTDDHYGHAVFETTLSTTVSGQGSVSRSTTSDRYEADSTVTLTASPDGGNLFIRWSGTVNSFENPVEVTVDQMHAITAVFIEDPNASVVTLTTTSNPAAGGVTSGAGDYSPGSYVTATATPDTGYSFYKWSGLSDSTTNPLVFVLNQDASLTARFLLNIADEDGDGLTNDEEINGFIVDEELVHYDLNPLESDSDADGLDDYAEIFTHGSNPIVNDTDGDGLSDAIEVNTFGTNPALSDSDRDGIDDFVETRTDSVTSAINSDTDGDGISDGTETYTFGTNPASDDSDGDGFPDKFELDSDYDPNDDSSTPDALIHIKTAVEVEINAARGGTYRIEHATELGGIWTIVEDNIIGNGALIKRLHSIDDYNRRFFRVIRTDQ
jgi:hypothetical protein